MIKTTTAALLLAATLCPAAAVAATGTDAGKRITGEQAARILQDAGYKAEIGKDGAGDPMISTSMGGLNAYLYFYDCEPDGCGSLKLSVGLDLEEGTSLAVVDAFNREHRYVTAFLDEENDPFLHYDFEVLHTRHAEHITSQVAIWEDLLYAFTVAVGYRTAVE